MGLILIEDTCSKWFVEINLYLIAHNYDTPVTIMDSLLNIPTRMIVTDHCGHVRILVSVCIHRASRYAGMQVVLYVYVCS